MDPVRAHLDGYSLQEFLALICWSIYGILRILVLSLMRGVILITRALESPSVEVEETTHEHEPVVRPSVTSSNPSAAASSSRDPPVAVGHQTPIDENAFLQGRCTGEIGAQELAAVYEAAGMQWRREGRRRYYAVGVGRRPGVYETPEECNAQILGFSGNKAQSFASRLDAELYVQRQTRRAENEAARGRVFQAVREVLDEEEDDID